MAVLVAHGRAEGAALHGARRIEIAGAGSWVENGTWFVVGEFFEGFFVMWLGEKDAGIRVAGEAGGEQAFA